MNVKNQLYKLTAILMVALLAFAAMPAKQASAAPDLQPALTAVTITSTQNWNVPAGVTSVRVEAWAGGGGGGGAFATNNYKGGGGAGGQYVTGVVDVTPSSSVTITIGGGGAGGSTATTNGAAGGDTSFGSLVVAKGGAGGGTMSTTSGYTGAAGLGSPSGATVPIGGTVNQGGNGSNGGSGAPAGGAGGGGAGSTGDGGNASGNTAGTGTATGGGNGGAGRTNAGVGNNGNTYGGGGGGGLRIGATDRNGGAGAVGRIVITYFTVTFDGNGSTGGAMSTQSGAKSTALTSNTFTRTGYIFDGWATSPGGAVAYNNGASYAFTADITLYAHWTAVLPDTPSVSNSPQTYTGSPIAITVSCASGGAATNIAPSSATTAGDHPVTADCPGNGGSYAATVGASAGNFVIDKATPTASIINSPVVYNGSEQTATVACLGGGAASLASGGVGTNAGSYPATVDCAASANYTAAAGLAAGNFVIDPATPTASITNSPVTYSGSEQTAIVACLGGGTATLATGGVGTNAGSYPATVNCEASANYAAASGLAAGNFVIDPATPTASITNSPTPYNGSEQTATVACLGGGAASLASGGVGTNAGSYPATVDCAESANYTAASALVAGNFVIDKATPTASITNSPVVYNGSQQTATVACLGGGTATLATGGVGTNAGSYPATVDCAESANYTAAAGLAAGNFVIDPATPTASITNSPVTYSGSQQTATVACLGGGAATLATGGTGTNAGSYPATVDCEASANYAAASGLAAGNFVIDPATPTASITNSPVTYNGSQQTATVACLGGGAATLATGGTGTNAGSYPATVDCAASANYAAVSGLAAGNFVIDPATPTASITNSPVTYNGSQQTATVACLGGGAATLATGGTGTNAGSYTATVDCAASANYTAASGLAAGNFVIDPATPTASITNSPVTYNGSQQTATVACLGGGTATLATGGVGTNAGSYPATVDCAASANYAAVSGLAAGNFVIDPATPTASITNSPVTYNGSQQTATVACLGGGAATLATGGTGTNADSYPATVNCAASTNYAAASGLAAGNFVIEKATPTISVGNSPVTYNGAPQAADVSGSVAGLASDLKYDGSSTIPTDAGAYAITADFTPTDTTNYNSLTNAAAGNFVIEKATPTISVDNSPVTYNGVPQAADVSGSVPGDVANVLYDGSSTVPTNADTYAITADFIPTDTDNYNSLTGASAGNFMIEKATLDVTADNQSKFTDEPDLQEADFTFVFFGFVDDDGESDIDTLPTCNVTGDQAVPGLLDIVCSGGADHNYDFNYINGTLTVNAVNNPPTDITLNNNTVDENTAIGTTVGQLSTTDDDVTDTFTYTLVDGGVTCPGTDNVSFQIDVDLLKTNAVFDFETKDTYVICVETDDDRGGTFEKEFTITVNDMEELFTESFKSLGGQDGWILESTTSSNTGGTMNKSATTLRLGDDAGNRQYRTILSFNTDSVPAEATITKVTLRVKRQGVVGGGNPVNKFGGFMIDLKKGTFNTPALALKDFNTKADQTLGAFKPAPSDNWYSFDLTGGSAQINVDGLTQIRLRFKVDDNANRIAEFLKLFSGNAGAANRPQLIIEYYFAPTDN